MKTRIQNSWGLSAMPAFVAKYRRQLVTNVEAIGGFAIVTLYVPAGSESKYRAAQEWKDFGQILAIP